MDARTARFRLISARVGHLATVTTENRAHVVPCCFVLHADTLYSAIDAKPKSMLAPRRLHNIMSTGTASLLVDHYEEDWTALWWVRADGTGRIVDEQDERARALVLLSMKYEQYRTAPPPGPVLSIRIERWRTWP